MAEIKIDKFIRDLERLKQSLPEIKEIIKTIALDEFDKNFDREAFFDEKWQEKKKPSEYVVNRGNDAGYNILQKTGYLRSSLRGKIEGENIIFYTLAEYGRIHNEGGTIRHPGGTAYYNIGQGKIVFVRNITAAMSERQYKRTQSHEIKIPKRQFAGWHSQLEREIEEGVNELVRKMFK